MNPSSPGPSVNDEIVVFLGPSLSVAEAEKILPATYLPPVKMGDVQELIRRRPKIICIIDGFFERVPAVWHKEILCALSRGIRVVGASSMGALRAAELHTFGMEGVGTIFRWFADGELDADDEVVLSHGATDAGYRAASEPLVNLRDGLARAEALGILTAAERAALVEEARKIFYPERAWGQTFADAKRIGVDPDRIARLRAFVSHERPNLKREDAILALKHIAETRDRPAAPVSFDFEPSIFWRGMVVMVAGSLASAPNGDATLAGIRKYGRTVIEDHRAFERQALLNYLVPKEAGRLGITVNDEEALAAGARIRREHGLASGEKTGEWLRDNGLTVEGFKEAARFEALTDKVITHYKRIVDKETIVALKRSGRFGEFARRAAELETVTPSPEEAGVTEQELVGWYERRVRPLRQSVDAYAKDRGFASRADFIQSALKLYLAERSAEEKKAG